MRYYWGKNWLEYMKKITGKGAGTFFRAWLLIVFIICSRFVFGQNNSTKQDNVPFSALFYKFGTNTLNSFTYNYGVNYILAGLGTYYFVHSGIDWEWNTIAANNKALAFSGTPFGALGFLIPVVVPLGYYFYGRSHTRSDMQIAGLAMGQAAILGVLISSSMKAFTGRRDPGILPEILHTKRGATDFSDDFAFGFMRRNIFSGWPSSHTAVMFAMAVTLAEMYPNNTRLKIIAYSYAALTGIGMSLFGHWASDVVSGALVGFAIGKSVGKGFKGLLGTHSNLSGFETFSSNNVNDMPGISITKNLSFNFLPYYVGFSVRY